jgi:thioredoxin 1
MAGGGVVHIKGDNWKTEVLDSAVPALVDFWAPWCGPCRVIGPILEELASETAGKLKVVKVDVDDNRDLAAKYGIRAIPTLLVLSQGSVKEQMMGALSKEVLKEKLSPYL